MSPISEFVYPAARSTLLSRQHFPEPGGAILCVANHKSEIRVALQNVGLVQHIDIAVREHLESGALVQVLTQWSKPFAGFYIYAPTRAQMPAKVRALIDFLVEKREALAARRPRSR